MIALLAVLVLAGPPDRSSLVEGDACLATGLCRTTGPVRPPGGVMFVALGLVTAGLVRGWSVRRRGRDT